MLTPVYYICIYIYLYMYICSRPLYSLRSNTADSTMRSGSLLMISYGFSLQTQIQPMEDPHADPT